MDNETFMQLTRDTALYPGHQDGGNLVYLTLGLVGESGEVAEVVKKVIGRSQPPVMHVGVAHREDGKNPEFVSFIDQMDLVRQCRTRVLDEVGDVLWYAFRIIDELGSTPEQVMAHTQAKLLTRKAEHGRAVRP